MRMNATRMELIRRRVTRWPDTVERDDALALVEGWEESQREIQRLTTLLYGFEESESPEGREIVR